MRANAQKRAIAEVAKSKRANEKKRIILDSEESGCKESSRVPKTSKSDF